MQTAGWTVDVNELSEHLHTPSPPSATVTKMSVKTETKKVENDATHMPLAPKKRPSAYISGTFEEARRKERRALSINLRKFVESVKGEQTAIQDRQAMLRAKRLEALQKRELKGEPTMRTHPDRKKHDYNDDKQGEDWLRKQFYLYFLGAGEYQRVNGSATLDKSPRQLNRVDYAESSAEDEDEDEYEHPATIKVEQSETIKKEQSGTIKKEQTDEDIKEEIKVKNNKLTEAPAATKTSHLNISPDKVVSRGYSREALAAESQVLESKPEPSAIRRQWKCMGRFGRMVVWPPFETEGQDGESAETGGKRKLSDVSDMDGSEAKKVVCGE